MAIEGFTDGSGEAGVDKDLHGAGECCDSSRAGKGGALEFVISEGDARPDVLNGDIVVRADRFEGISSSNMVEDDRDRGAGATDKGFPVTGVGLNDDTGGLGH